ncbi:MAG: DUF370 domain-containing protein [Clostridia bacterium]|nr:DUF370 domain-containing protein [Clostridia bacterium]
MYLHLGQDTVVRQTDIVGIFDLESTTVVAKTREYLKKAEQNKNVVNVSFELPASFVVCARPGTGENTVYITPISAQTLKKRVESGFVPTEER